MKKTQQKNSNFWREARRSGFSAWIRRFSEFCRLFFKSYRPQTPHTTGDQQQVICPYCFAIHLSPPPLSLYSPPIHYTKTTNACYVLAMICFNQFVFPYFDRSIYAMWTEPMNNLDLYLAFRDHELDVHNIYEFSLRPATPILPPHPPTYTVSTRTILTYIANTHSVCFVELSGIAFKGQVLSVPSGEYSLY